MCWSGLSGLMYVHCVLLVCSEKKATVQLELMLRENCIYVFDVFSLNFSSRHPTPVPPTDPHVANDQQETRGLPQRDRAVVLLHEWRGDLLQTHRRGHLIMQYYCVRIVRVRRLKQFVFWVCMHL